jgi:hypothetical protein
VAASIVKSEGASKGGAVEDFGAVKEFGAA